jgi:hypothetical protein
MTSMTAVRGSGFSLENRMTRSPERQQLPVARALRRSKIGLIALPYNPGRDDTVASLCVVLSP